MPTYQFKIRLENINEPKVWRRVLVSSTITLHVFHEVIQAAFGWENYHLYSFSQSGYRSKVFYGLPVDDDYNDFGPTNIDSGLIKISEIFTAPKQKFTYIYDFGDDWKHSITLEKILDEGVMYPVCTGGIGACPPEDCGGPWGYSTLKETLANPKSPEYKDTRSWLGLKRGEQLDINAFDIDAVNIVLRSIS